MQWTVRPYTPADEAEWDRFVMHESGNGTFLQTRNFLNYHPAGRFTDASLYENFPLPPGQQVWGAGAGKHLQLRG